MGRATSKRQGRQPGKRHAAQQDELDLRQRPSDAPRLREIGKRRLRAASPPMRYPDNER
jgi:hypothetical protein